MTTSATVRPQTVTVATLPPVCSDRAVSVAHAEEQEAVRQHEADLAERAALLTAALPIGRADAERVAQERAVRKTQLDMLVSTGPQRIAAAKAKRLAAEKTAREALSTPARAMQRDVCRRVLASLTAARDAIANLEKLQRDIDRAAHGIEDQGGPVPGIHQLAIHPSRTLGYLCGEGLDLMRELTQ